MVFREPSEKEGHPMWIKEIREEIAESHTDLRDKLKSISNNLGPLAMLITCRFEKYNHVMMNGSR